MTQDLYRHPSTEVHISSPDDGIWVDFTDLNDLGFGFRGDAYANYDESTLAYQLGQAGKLAWVAHRRARQEEHRTALGLTPSEADAARATRPAGDGRRERYTARLNELVAEGTCPDGAIVIRTTGMAGWQVDIAPDTLRRLGEAAFVARTMTALRAMMADRETKIASLKAELFDMGVPRRWAEMLDRLRAENRARAAAAGQPPPPATPRGRFPGEWRPGQRG